MIVQDVQHVVRSLHAQGVYPSLKQVAAQMSHPRSLQLAEAKIVYRQLLRDLNLE